MMIDSLLDFSELWGTWTFRATVCGLISGIGAALFLLLLDQAIALSEAVPLLCFGLPLIFVVCVLVNKQLPKTPNLIGFGTETMIDAYNKEGERIPVSHGPVKALLSVLTIAFGGSAGKEGPSSLLSVSLCSWFAQRMKYDEKDSKIIMLCAMAAGFSAVFGAPFASAFFAIELAVLVKPRMRVLYPAIISAWISYLICWLVGVKYIHTPIAMPPVTEMLWLQVFGCVLVGAILAALYTWSMRGFEKFYKITPLPNFVKALMGGCVVLAIGLLAGPDSMGLGETSFHTLLVAGGIVAIALPILKIILTAITLQWGGVGGVITPMFYIGIHAGAVYGYLIGVDAGQLPFFAVLGLLSVLTACCKTPISALLLGMELFGVTLTGFYIPVIVLTYVLTWKLSFFRTQIRLSKKSCVKAPALDAVSK